MEEGLMEGRLVAVQVEKQCKWGIPNVPNRGRARVDVTGLLGDA